VSGSHGDQFVDGYLARLAQALADLPPPRQQELLNDVQGHIADARAGLRDETDADVLNILDRIGEPADIAAETRERLGVQPSQPASIGILEIAALVLTPFLWPVGVIRLWASSAWNTRDKLIGTLVPPGGYLGLGILSFLSLVAVHAGNGACAQPADLNSEPIGPASCQYFGPPPPPAWVGLLAALVVGVLLVLPLLTAVYLGLRLRRPQLRSTVPA